MTTNLIHRIKVYKLTIRLLKVNKQVKGLQRLRVEGHRRCKVRVRHRLIVRVRAKVILKNKNQKEPKWKRQINKILRKIQKLRVKAIRSLIITTSPQFNKYHKETHQDIWMNWIDWFIKIIWKCGKKSDNLNKNVIFIFNSNFSFIDLQEKISSGMLKN